MICLDTATPELALKALDGKPIYVEDEYVLFERRVKALMEWLGLKHGISIKRFLRKLPKTSKNMIFPLLSVLLFYYPNKILYFSE